MSAIQEILTETTFKQVPGEYIYAKLSKGPDNPNSFFMMSFDKDEVTVVTKAENYQNLNAVERNKDNYALFELCVTVPFYAVGFLASVTSAIAAKGMNVLVVSTYSKDYILVRTEHTDLAKETLRELGMKETK